MTATPRKSLILQKAREALKQAERLVEYFERNGIPEPDFTSTSPEHPIDHEFDAIRIDLTQSAQDLILLAEGPLQWLRTFMCSHHDFAAWQIALRFKFFSIIPLDKPMSVKDIASATKMDEDRLERVMKLLATQRCFNEVEEGVFEHTALSVFIAQNKDIEATIAFQTDEFFEASSLAATSVENDPYKCDITNTPFALRLGAPPYQYYKENKERGARFALAMAGYGRMNRDIADVRDLFPWSSLGKKTIVDVGGGSGHISIILATHFPNLKFVVQDIDPGMLSQGALHPDFKPVEDRVSFMQYDFFQPQPVTDASIFFLRQIFHNHDDELGAKILKSLVPTLEKSAPGTSLLINDMVLPAANTRPKVLEHNMRHLDIIMMNSLAAKERSLAQWSALLKKADERFKIVNVYQARVMGILEVQLIV